MIGRFSLWNFCSSSYILDFFLVPYPFCDFEVAGAVSWIFLSMVLLYYYSFKINTYVWIIYYYLLPLLPLRLTESGCWAIVYNIFYLLLGSLSSSVFPVFLAVFSDVTLPCCFAPSSPLRLLPSHFICNVFFEVPCPIHPYHAPTPLELFSFNFFHQWFLSQRFSDSSVSNSDSSCLTHYLPKIISDNATLDLCLSITAHDSPAYKSVGEYIVL